MSSGRLNARAFLRLFQLLGPAAAGHDLIAVLLLARGDLCLHLARAFGRSFPIVLGGVGQLAIVVEVEVDLLLRLRTPIADLAEVVELTLEAGFQERLQTPEQIPP